MKLKRCATADLVTELARRESIHEVIAEVNQPYAIKVKGRIKETGVGPARVLIITD
jgi:hypothetical protein